MNARFFIFVIAVAGLGWLAVPSPAQTVLPVPPPPIRKDKAAIEAATIQAPQINLPPGGPRLSAPPTLPSGASQRLPDARPASANGVGTLKMTPPPANLRPGPLPLPPVIDAAPAGQPPVISRATTTVPAPAPPVSSLTKEQALDAATKPSKMGIEAPRIPTPSDKIPVVSSTSASGQFHVHGNDLSLRSRMSSHLDEIAAELRTALNDGEPHVIPVNVRLSQGAEAIKATSAGAPPVGVQITEIEGGGFHLQMDIRDVPALKLRDIRREAVRILLAERILRGHQTATPPKDRLLLPDWVFTGTLQTLDFRSAERPATMFAAIFKSGKIYGIEEIITASPTEMDSLSRAIYDTSCGALLMALIEQPDGGKRFNKFLNALAVDPKPERDLLNEAFPGFAASASSLNKWWSLQLASLAKRRVADPLSADETIRALEDAITIRYIAKNEEVPKDIKKRPFDIPSPLFVPPPPKPKTPPPSLEEDLPVVADGSAPKKPATKAISKSAEDGGADEDASVSKKAGSPWLRYLTFGLMGSGKEDDGKSDDVEAPKKGSAPEKTVSKADMPPETKKEAPAEKEEDGNPGFFGRLMARENLTAAAERQKAAEEMARAQEEKEEKEAEAKKKAEEAAAKKKAEEEAAANSAGKSAAKPKTPAAQGKDETKPEEKERGSLINPLNWFRGSKKAEDDKQGEKPKSEDKAKKTKEEAEGKKSALWLDWAPGPIALLNWHVAPLAELWTHFSPWSDRHAFLDFLKRKKPKEEDKDKAKKAAEPEKPKPVSVPAKKKEEPKSQGKSPPKTTNPNARPAAKPVQPADGSQRTTNPAAKPLPVPKPPPASDDPGNDDLPSIPAGSQMVELHLEDYQHILKRPDRVKILERNAATLRALHARCSVLMRPVVNGYLSIVLDIQEGKMKDIDKRLKELRGYVTLTAQQTKAVRDFVDYYEANETEQLSGKFDDFLDLSNIIQRELPPREDPIARYLDAIDKEFSR